MKRYIAIISALILLSACKGKDNEYVLPVGEPDWEYSIGVYFDEGNVSDYMFATSEGNCEFTVNLHRVDRASAADVPLVLECSEEGMVVPATVHFNTGSRDASFTVNCDAMPKVVRASYKITIPDDYLFVYNDSHPNSFNGTVLVSDWENVNNDGSDVRFIFCAKDYISKSDETPASSIFSPYESRMEVFPGGNLYRIHDFLGSGETLEFSLLKSQFSDFNKFYRIVPSESYYWTNEDTYGETYHHFWYFKGSKADYKNITCSVRDLENKPAIFTEPGFYHYSSSYSKEYCYARTGEKCAASMWFSFSGAAESCPQYFYLYFEWDNWDKI